MGKYESQLEDIRISAQNEVSGEVQHRREIILATDEQLDNSDFKYNLPTVSRVDKHSNFDQYAVHKLGLVNGNVMVYGMALTETDSDFEEDLESLDTLELAFLADYVRCWSAFRPE